MGSKLSREELKSDSDLPRTSETKIRRAQSVRAGSDFEQQHISLSPFLQGRNERQNKPKLVSSTVGRVQKSSDSQQVHNNLVSELKEFQKLRQTPVSRPKLTDSLFIQPHVTVPQFNERLVAPNLRNSEIKSNSVKTEPTIVGNNLPQQLRKAPIPPPRIRSNNSENLLNKNSGQQSNIVMKDQRVNEVQQPRENSKSENNTSSGEKKIESEQHLNNDSEPETSDSLHEKCYDPKDTTLKFVDDEDTLDILCEGFKSLRALMSCGHAVTPTSLTEYCHWLLGEGETDIVCGVPGCDHVWPLEEVCKMALLTQEEIEYFEKRMFEIKKSWFDVKSCPGCKSNVIRSDPNNLCVACTVCTSDNKSYSFCWQCLRRWRGPAPRTDRCNNEGCTNEALETLKNCPEMTFNDVAGVVGCPSIRACPCCGLLVSHNKKFCKCVTCDRCKKNFCFVCLESKASCRKKSDVYGPCATGMAPRQTSIPVLKL